ncbi:amidase family protein [Bacillus sp. SL00103]
MHGIWQFAQMASFHQTYDLFVTPATAYSAPKVGELMHSKEEITQLLRVSSLSMQARRDLIYDMFLKSLTYTPFTQLANLTGQPSMSVPVHLTEAGMPLGVQVTAPKGKRIGCFDLRQKWKHPRFGKEQINLYVETTFVYGGERSVTREYEEIELFKRPHFFYANRVSCDRIESNH